MPITIQELQGWLSVATGFATLAAFVIALIQLRNVRRAMELQTNLAVMQAERSIWTIGLAHPETCPTVLRERWGEPAGDRLFAAMLIDHYEAVYFQHRRGAIPRSLWLPQQRAMVEHIASPLIRQVWEGHKDLYWPPFRALVERELARLG